MAIKQWNDLPAFLKQSPKFSNFNPKVKNWISENIPLQLNLSSQDLYIFISIYLFIHDYYLTNATLFIVKKAYNISL